MATTGTGTSSGTMMGMSAISSAFVGLMQGFAERESIRARGIVEQSRARVDKNIALFKGREALYASRRRGSVIRSRINTLTGAQRTSIAAQGIDPHSGSAAAAIIESRYLGDLDVMEVETSGKLQALGFEMQALNAGGREQFSRLATKASSKQTVLSTGAGIARTGMRWGATQYFLNRQEKDIAISGMNTAFLLDYVKRGND